MAKEYMWNLTDLKKVPKNGYKVFTTFSCGGGSSMGYKLAGYEVLGNCEIDPKINEMYVKNHHPKYNFLMGVQDFYKQDNIPEELFDLDVLDGSPPCSTFSMAGEREKNWGKEKRFREGQAKQMLSDLFFEFIKVADLLKPKVIVAENVKGIVAKNAKGYMNLIIKNFNEIGYNVQIFALNAATMGVPQKRERVFFVCRRKDLEMPPIRLDFNKKPILYKEFADSDYKHGNKESLTYTRWLKRIPSDRTIADIVSRTEGKNSGFGEPIVHLNEVLPTLTANGRIHRYEVFGEMSDRDMKIMSTFPLDYDFNGNSVKYVCGMSVPPFMMKGVAEAVATQLLPYAKHS